MTKNLTITPSRPGLKGDTLPSLSRSKDQPAEHKNTRAGHPGQRPLLTRRTGTTEEAVLMPRRPAKIERDIPLYLIAPVVKREVSTHGEDLERVIVWKTGSHFYNISVRTRPVKRELRSAWARSRIREGRQGDAEDKGTDDGREDERG